MKFKEKIMRFMYGRYGADEFYRFLTILFYVLFIINLFIGSYLLSLVTLAILVYATFRIFSRNIYKRREENAKYLSIKNAFKNAFKLRKDKWRDRKTHVYRKCPACHATIRFPKKKGKHSARCPKCSASFDVKV